MEGERKQVTVLFADVKGSMDLAEQVGPEEWHEIMGRRVRHHGRALQSLAPDRLLPMAGQCIFGGPTGGAARAPAI